MESKRKAAAWFSSLLLASSLAGSVYGAAARGVPASIKTSPAFPVSPLGAALSGLGQLSAPSLTPAALVPGVLFPALSAPQVQPAPGLTAAPLLPPAAQVEALPVQPNAFAQRLGRVEAQLADPLQTAADGKAGADSSHEAGREIEETLTGQGAISANDDLPPAGPVAELSDAQVSWLSAQLVQGPQPLLSEPGFQALVNNDAAAMEQILPWLRDTPQALETTLSAVYNSLVRVIDSGLPAPERSALAQSLNARLSAAVETMSRSAILSPRQRQILAEVHGRYLANYAALDELAHHRQTSAHLDAVGKRAVSLVAPQAAQDFTEDRWIFQPPLPAEQRGQGEDVEERILLSLTDSARNVKDWEFYLEKYLSRYRIAALNPRFSQRIRELTTQTLSTYLGRFFQVQGSLHSNVERIAGYSLPTSFINPSVITARPRRIVWVPGNANLRLAAQPDGYRVEAVFETDIQDDAVLKTVKASIEEYWSGRFEWAGRSLGFSVDIAIKKLAPGQEFSPGSLKIRDSRGGVSHATSDTIVLDRNLRYDVPAHEFGHILGLADEYREGYDPDLAAAVMLQRPASIMGSPKGKVLPRHFRLAYQLLRRRSVR